MCPHILQSWAYLFAASRRRDLWPCVISPLMPSNKTSKSWVGARSDHMDISVGVTLHLTSQWECGRVTSNVIVCKRVLTSGTTQFLGVRSDQVSSSNYFGHMTSFCHHRIWAISPPFKQLQQVRNPSPPSRNALSTSQHHVIAATLHPYRPPSPTPRQNQRPSLPDLPQPPLDPHRGYDVHPQQRLHGPHPQHHRHP